MSHFKQGIRCTQKAAWTPTQIHWKKDCNEDHQEAQEEKKTTATSSATETGRPSGHTRHGCKKEATVPSPCVPGSQAVEHILQTCPSYNMLRKTPVKTSMQTCPGHNMPRKTPVKTSMQTCPGHNMLRQTPAETSLRTRPGHNMLRKTPVKTSLETCPGHNMLRKTPVKTSLRTRPGHNMLRQTPVETSLETCPGHNMLRKTPVETSLRTRPGHNMLRKTPLQRPPWRHVLATICWGRLNDRWRPPSRQSSAALNRNCRGQLNSPRRQDHPCGQKNEVEEEEKRDNWNIKDATALPTVNNPHSSPASTHNGGCGFPNKTTQLRERSAHL